MADSSIGGANTSGRNVASFGGSKSLPGNNAVQGFTAGGHQPQNQWGAGDYVNFTSINYGGLSGIGLVISMIGQLYLLQKQIGLAKDYYDTNKQDFYFFRDNYAGGTGPVIGSGPLITHKDQAFTTPFYAVDYYPMTGGALGKVKIYDKKWLQSRRRAHRYALGHQKQLDYSYYMLRRKASFSAFAAGRRIEDARKDWKDEQIQTHKIQALNFGITAGNIARQGLATATGRLESAYDELGSRLGGLANGAGRANGYQAGKDIGKQILDRSSAGGVNMAPHAIGTGGE